MADRSDMTITIGGQVRASVLFDLADAFAESEMSPCDWDADLLDAGDIFELIVETAAKRETLTFFRREVAGGMDEELETGLRELGVTYCRTSDSHYAYSASVSFWKPGMNEARDWTGDNDGIPYLSAGEIREGIKGGTLDAEVELMLDACELPALAIVEDMGAPAL